MHLFHAFYMNIFPIVIDRMFGIRRLVSSFLLPRFSDLNYHQICNAYEQKESLTKLDTSRFGHYVACLETIIAASLVIRIITRNYSRYASQATT